MDNPIFLPAFLGCHTHSDSLHHRVPDSYSVLYRFLPVFGTVDTGKGSNSQVCERAIGGITTCHKMRHTVRHSLRHLYERASTFSSWPFLHSRPIQTPPSGPGLICATGHVFIWDDPSVTPLSRYFHSSIHNMWYEHLVLRCKVLLLNQESCFWMEAYA